MSLLKHSFNFSYTCCVTKKSASFVLALLFFLLPLNSVFAQETSTTDPTPAEFETSGVLFDTDNQVNESSAVEQDQVLSEAQVTDIKNKDLTKEQQAQIKDLDKQLKNGEITQEEYDSQLAVVNAEGSLENSALRTSEPVSPESQTLGKYISPTVSGKDGALTYEYPVTVPPGRNGLTPDLKLIYNSSNKSPSSIISSGWSFNIPYIQRMNKKGVDKLYTENIFLSSLDGELVDQGSGIFLPRTENGKFLKYTFSNNTWSVTDKFGTTYVFGSTTQARQDNPSDTSKIFSWMLESVTDSNGNKINYTYFKDQGQIYPDSIKYNQENFFEIKFNRTTNSVSQAAYTSAFLVKNAYKINRIDILENQTIASKIDFTFDTENLLSKLQVTGYEGGQSSVLPETSFEYYLNNGNGWNTTPAIQNTNSGAFGSNASDITLNNNNSRQHVERQR